MSGEAFALGGLVVMVIAIPVVALALVLNS